MCTAHQHGYLDCCGYHPVYILQLGHAAPAQDMFIQQLFRACQNSFLMTFLPTPGEFCSGNAVAWNKHQEHLQQIVHQLPCTLHVTAACQYEPCSRDCRKVRSQLLAVECFAVPACLPACLGWVVGGSLKSVYSAISHA